jgi:uncharacterized membrane protein YqaE (UPF0057 family)
MKLARWIFAVLLPPVGIFFTYGVSVTLVINILLTLLGWVPGVIHAVWAIAKHDEKMNQLDQSVNQSEGTV